MVKILFGTAAALISIVSYVPYILDTIKGKVRPHPVSWFAWFFMGFLVTAGQVAGGAGAGAWVVGVNVLLSFIVLVLSLRAGNKVTIKKGDWVCLVVGMAAFFSWLILKEPVLSVMLIVVADMCIFLPTLRKTYGKPFEENLIVYAASILKMVLALFALEQVNLLTALFPIYLVVINALFVGMTLIRRKTVGRR